MNGRTFAGLDAALVALVRGVEPLARKEYADAYLPGRDLMVVARYRTDGALTAVAVNREQHIRNTGTWVPPAPKGCAPLLVHVDGRASVVSTFAIEVTK